eukprot:CAMPEP_0195521476 /NCGR_PEP_ID=MMETSP0794_2-20130614/18770_1 /TAXON_ID=515487 /ORGANISM="Stephanopyxis turris, Strain CCMP 815" /LENGTH=248 /DNA_ID=CAMNT_0040651047 /DNA_START=159 /DNA_END=905 /DNA_ORIENTATION=-
MNKAPSVLLLLLATTVILTTASESTPSIVLTTQRPIQLEQDIQQIQEEKEKTPAKEELYASFSPEINVFEVPSGVVIKSPMKGILVETVQNGKDGDNQPNFVFVPDKQENKIELINVKVDKDVTNTSIQTKPEVDEESQIEEATNSDEEATSSASRNLSTEPNQGGNTAAAWANTLYLSASMALLLGAFSARKLMKARKYLFEVFESDDEDDFIGKQLEYDVASTFGVAESYGSFATPWTGDLEKFDV